MKALIIGAHLLRDDIEPVARALPAGELFLSAIDLADEQPAGDRALLLRTASIRGELVRQATFVAIRYGFLVRSDEEGAERCSRHLARWRLLLEKHRDHVEITLKAVAGGVVPRPSRTDFANGADYLRALHRAARASEIDPGLRRAVEELLVPLTVEHRWLHRDGRSVEMAALVDRSRMTDLAQAGEALRSRCPDAPFLLSGPWPLEVFADDDHE